MQRDLARIFEDFINQADYMNGRIKEGTEKYRKGDAKITISAGGKACEGAKVTYKHKKHEFKFGANCFMIDEMETEEKNKAYKENFAKAFNLATVPFYWRDLEPTKGQPRYAADSPKIYRRPAPDLCINYCKENGIEPKLHCLNYDIFGPAWYRDKKADEQKVLLETHMAEIAERYADIIPDIEVTNEHWWELHHASDFYTKEDYVEWSYKTADKYFPKNNLIINDGPDITWWAPYRGCIERQAYYLLIERALAKGCRIDKIGMQYHIWDYKKDMYENTRIIFNPERLYAQMDAYGKLAPELQVTEITLPAKGNAPEDEEYQAEILEKLYRIWFSHPNMQAVIYWNLVDGYAHLAEPGDMTAGENVHYGGLINFDSTPKKAYYKLLDLVHNEWNTSGDAVLDENGSFDFRGFYGDYELEIICGDKKYTKTISTSKYRDNNITVEL